MRAKWAVLGLVVAFVGVTAYSLTHGGPSVGRYCMYGAVSEAQLDQCVAHVESEDFAHSNTHAALYGRGLLDACLEDAGPFCEGTRAATSTAPPERNAIDSALDESGGWTIGGG